MSNSSNRLPRCRKTWTSTCVHETGITHGNIARTRVAGKETTPKVAHTLDRETAFV